MLFAMWTVLWMDAFCHADGIVDDCFLLCGRVEEKKRIKVGGFDKKIEFTDFFVFEKL